MRRDSTFLKDLTSAIVLLAFFGIFAAALYAGQPIEGDLYIR